MSDETADKMFEMVRWCNRASPGASLIEWIFVSGIHFDLKRRRATLGSPEGEEIPWDEAVSRTPFFDAMRRGT